MDIKRIVRKSYEQFCDHKFDNLNESDHSLKEKFAKTYIRVIQKGLYLLKIHLIMNYLLKQIASGILCS